MDGQEITALPHGWEAGPALRADQLLQLSTAPQTLSQKTLWNLLTFPRIVAESRHTPTWHQGHITYDSFPTTPMTVLSAHEEGIPCARSIQPH